MDTEYDDEMNRARAIIRANPDRPLEAIVQFVRAHRESWKWPIDAVVLGMYQHKAYDDPKRARVWAMKLLS